MEKMEGKYFENTINKLKKAKDAECVEMREEFRLGLRAGLVEKSKVLPTKADWSDIILRWKYLFGAVPALAVLIVVATNVVNLQTKIPTPGLASLNIDQGVSLGATVDSTVQNENIRSAQMPHKSGIVTFSAALVMPSADDLSNARAEGRMDSVTTMAPSEANQPIQNDDPSQSLNSNDATVKLNTPELKTILFYSDKTGAAVPVSTQLPKVNVPVPLPVDNALARPGLVDSLTIVPPVAASLSPVEGAIRLENNARVEDFQRVGEASLNQNNQVVPTVIETAVQPSDVVKTFSQPVLPTLVSPAVLDSARIIYGEADKPLIDSLVLRELKDRNGSLSSDYYVRVSKLENEMLELSLFELGKAKKIVLMGKDAYGEYQTVTTINY